MDLIDALADFDGKSVGPLRAIAAKFDECDGAVLVGACSGEYAIAATWVVKALLEKGLTGGLDLDRVFAGLAADQPWESTLHLLQSVQYAPEAALPKIVAIRALLDHPKTLVRVWALDAFARLALVDHRFLPDAEKLVQASLDGGAASLRVRARHLQELLDQVVP